MVEDKGGYLQLLGIISDLIEILHDETEVLDKIIDQVEQVTTHLPEARHLSAMSSQLSGLHVRIRKLEDSYVNRDISSA